MTSSTVRCRSTARSGTRPTCRSRPCTATPARHASTTGPTRSTARAWPRSSCAATSPHPKASHASTYPPGARPRASGSRTCSRRSPPTIRRAIRALVIILAVQLVLGGAVVFAATQDFFGAGAGDKRAAPAAGRADRFDVKRAWRLVRMQLATGPRPAPPAPPPAPAQRPAASPQRRGRAEPLRRLLPRGRFEDLDPESPGLRNIVGDLPGRGPPILIGAHYDTQAEPEGFVGANDSAAGTAAVIELARALRPSRARAGRAVRFVLFDRGGEPAGQSDRPFQTSGLRGSRAYVEAHPDDARELVLLDYVAARGSTFRRENDSDPAVWARLRAAARAASVGAYFPPGDQGVGIVDDTFPFLQRGIPAVDIIDWGYRYKQGTQDTLDKLDRRVLDAVGEAVAALVGRGG